MLLERTISQLDIGEMPVEKAIELGQLGYIQWLMSLPADLDYVAAAKQANAMAHPCRFRSPAVAVFCDLLLASTIVSPWPLPIAMPAKGRRGGALARRFRRAAP